jgi:hypothetical protein
VLARRGTNDAHGSSMSQHERHRVLSLRKQPWHVARQQCQRHVKGIHLSACGQFHWEGVQQVGQQQAGPPLLVDHAPCGTPQQTQAQVLFALAESQFAIPSARIQASDVGQRAHGGIEHIGQAGGALAAETKTDQAHDLSGLIRAMHAQIHQGIVDAVGLREEVLHLVARLADRAREVPVPLLREVIQPGKTALGALTQDERAGGQAAEHGTGMSLAVGGGIQQHVEALPVLQAHLKEAHQPSRQQATVAVWHRAQPHDPALDLVEHTFVTR